MRNRIVPMSWGTVLASVLLAAPFVAQDTAAPAPKRPVVEVWGASVSAGFTDPRPRADGEPNSSARLAVALRGLWGEGAVDVRDRSDVATFLRPFDAQSRHVERGLADEPAAVVAIDFMFWFGYGSVRGDDRQARLALQARGFELLDKVKVPILVGDYPDMHGADPRMLSSRQIPSVEMIGALNERLRAYAAARANVRLFPLADFVTRAKGEGVVVQHAGTALRLDSAALLQGDGLHATRLGVALLGRGIGDNLRELLAADDPVRPREVSYFDMVGAVGGEVSFGELLEAAGQPAAGGGR